MSTMRSLATATSLVAVDEVGGGATVDVVVGVMYLFFEPLTVGKAPTALY
jgi:hypothetical protein